MRSTVPRYLRLLIGTLCFNGAIHHHVYAAKAAPEARPNIAFVFCDDLGYSEIQALNPERGKIPTPSADKLADQGMIFTDAQSGSLVCFPTRYGLLTGRYSWRAVVKGFAPNLIAEDRPHFAQRLRADRPPEERPGRLIKERPPADGCALHG